MIDDEGDALLDWISPAELIPSLEATTTVLRILTIFSLYEDAVEDGKVPIPVESKYHDFCSVMRDMLCQTWRLFYLLFRRILGIATLRLPTNKAISEDSREKINRCCELLSLVHEELGVHKWCNHGDGWSFVFIPNSRKTTGVNDESIFEVQYGRLRP